MSTRIPIEGVIYGIVVAILLVLAWLWEGPEGIIYWGMVALLLALLGVVAGWIGRDLDNAINHYIDLAKSKPKQRKEMEEGDDE